MTGTTDQATDRDRARDTLFEALGLSTEQREAANAIGPFATQLATYISESESNGIDPGTVASAAQAYLGLRLAWNPNPAEIADRSETMWAIKDALSASRYNLGLDGVESDLHSPDGEGLEVDEEFIEDLVARSYEEPADLGIVDAWTWHAMVAAVMDGRAPNDDPAKLIAVQKEAFSAVVTRIATGSHDIDDHHQEICRVTVDDMLRTLSEPKMLEASLHLRRIFSIESNADEAASDAFDHAVGTISDLASCEHADFDGYLQALRNGSVTGNPYADEVCLVETAIEVETEGDADQTERFNGLSNLLVMVLAGMTVCGRLPLMDEHRTLTAIRMATVMMAQALDEEDDPDSEILLEEADRSLRTAFLGVDHFIETNIGMMIDRDAVVARRTMDVTDPTPPPEDQENILPRAVMITTKEGVDPDALRHLIDAFMSPTTFIAFGPGDIYWRLDEKGSNAYGATVSALRTISMIDGVETASVVHRNAQGLSVTTIRKGSAPVHRRVRFDHAEG